MESTIKCISSKDTLEEVNIQMLEDVLQRNIGNQIQRNRILCHLIISSGPDRNAYRRIIEPTVMGVRDAESSSIAVNFLFDQHEGLSDTQRENLVKENKDLILGIPGQIDRLVQNICRDNTIFNTHQLAEILNTLGYTRDSLLRSVSNYRRGEIPKQERGQTDSTSIINTFFLGENLTPVNRAAAGMISA